MIEADFLLMLAYGVLNYFFHHDSEPQSIELAHVVTESPSKANSLAQLGRRGACQNPG